MSKNDSYFKATRDKVLEQVTAMPINDAVVTILLHNTRSGFPQKYKIDLDTNFSKVDLTELENAKQKSTRLLKSALYLGNMTLDKKLTRQVWNLFKFEHPGFSDEIYPKIQWYGMYLAK